jgi:hypothetical protein
MSMFASSLSIAQVRDEELESAGFLLRAVSLLDSTSYLSWFFFEQNSASDSTLLAADGRIRRLQVVSTQGPVIADPTETVWARIRQKHAKGWRYAEGHELVILITQAYWRPNLAELSCRLRVEHSFQVYWTITPTRYGRRVDCLWSTANAPAHPVSLRHALGCLRLGISRDSMPLEKRTGYQRGRIGQSIGSEGG